MKKFLISLFVLVSTSASALEIGIYEGKTPQGEDCLLGIQSIDYTNSYRHPMNERVKLIISFSESTFLARYLYSVDQNLGEIQIDRETLDSTLANAKGLEAMELKMIHTDTYDGPSVYKYVFTPDASRTDLVAKNLTCGDLRKRE